MTYSLFVSGTHTDTLALGRGEGGGAALAGGEGFREISSDSSAAAIEDEDGGKQSTTGGSGNQEGGVGPWKLDPSEMSHDNVLLLLLLLLLLSRSYFQQLRRMAIEAVALLQAGASSCTRHNPEIETQNFSSPLPSGLLSEAIEAASSVISSNPRLAIMCVTRHAFLSTPNEFPRLRTAL